MFESAQDNCGLTRKNFGNGPSWVGALTTSRGQNVKQTATDEAIFHNVHDVHSVHGVQNVNSVNDDESSTVRDEDSARCFTGRSMNDWLSLAASKPVPMRLFDDFWAEGELGVLFADTAAGKSALAMQIGDSICRGEPIRGFEMEALPQAVLYFDFELTEMQLQRRYAVECRAQGRVWFEDHYQFHPSLCRFEINAAVQLFDVPDWETLLIGQIERAIVDSEARIVVLDNITYLSHETEKGRFAIPLMQRLNELKKEHSLSILVLAHTPKRDDGRPISINDLAGSKSLANFADSVFAIGKSQKDTSLRYLKQIKARSTLTTYDQYNVPVFTFEKRNNFLGFDFIECQEESEHLAPMSKSNRAELIDRAKALAGQGKRQREIAEELGIGASTVNKYLKL